MDTSTDMDMDSTDSYTPRLGDIVLYRTRPCRTPDEGPDIDLYANYARDDRAAPVDRPAIVLRAWPDRTLDLRVLADGDPLYDRWRNSVVAGASADQLAAGGCWTPRPASSAA